MTQKEIKHALTEIRKRARGAARTCSYEKCDKLAIQSHLLQKNGILNQISDASNQVMELAVDAYKPDTFVFKPVSIKQAVTFPGFCNEHDTSIFKEIEQGEIDYTAYRTQMLFSYRALIQEMYKKVENIDVYNRILKSFKLRLFVGDDYLKGLGDYSRQEKLAIGDCKFYEDIFLRDINDSELRDFDFMTYDLPKIEVCASGVFTYETTHEMDGQLWSGTRGESDPFTQIYFNLLPIGDKSVVIIGCLKERKYICWDYVSSFNSNNKSDSLKRISDLFLCQLENWLCSTEFYKQNLKFREREITKITQQSMAHSNERRSLTFNLFENIDIQ